MKLKKLIRKKKHKTYIAEYILCLDFECDNLRKKLRSVNDKTLIRKMIFKTKLQRKYSKRLQLLNFQIMEEQIKLYEYRIEAIINRVSESIDKLEKLQDSSGNLSYTQGNQLEEIITDLKEIQ